MLGQSQFNSFLPTIKAKQFSDSFKGLTFFVEKKMDNEIQNVFLHDTGNNLKNFSSNIQIQKALQYSLIKEYENRVYF